jgi:hypothetical protein
MGGEEAGAGLGEGGKDGGEGVEGVGVDDGGGGVFGKEIEDFGIVSAAEAGADDESVVGEFEGGGVGGHGFDHDFGREAGGEELVEVGFDQEGDHAGAAVKGAEAGEFGGPEEAGGAGDDEEASGLGFVGVEGAAGEEGAKESGGDEFGGIAGGGDEVGEGDEGEAADVMGGGVGDEAGFDLSDGEGEIGLEAVGMGDAGVGIEATGEVHGDGLSVGGGAEGVHLRSEGRERGGQGAGGADAEEAVEEDDGAGGEIGGVEGVGLDRDLFFEGGEVVGREIFEGAEGKGESGPEAPALGVEVAGGDEGVTGVVALAEVEDGGAGAGMELQDGLGDAGSGLIHEVGGRDADGEGLVLDFLHLAARDEHDGNGFGDYLAFL